jgi:hypothetical protein
MTACHRKQCIHGWALVQGYVRTILYCYYQWQRFRANPATTQLPRNYHALLRRYRADSATVFTAKLVERRSKQAREMQAWDRSRIHRLNSFAQHTRSIKGRKRMGREWEEGLSWNGRKEHSSRNLPASPLRIPAPPPRRSYRIPPHHLDVCVCFLSLCRANQIAYRHVCFETLLC